ncbi:MAG: hypothetical protein K2Y20_15820 [Sphingomonas sp.]|nr:hypothetical protein [Sphingomonas sp.]
MDIVMGKRRPTLTDNRLREEWSVRQPDGTLGYLEGLDKFMASAVSRCLREDSRSRRDIAEALSDCLSERISPLMLDVYSSEARREHPIPAHRFIALIAVTERYDVLDAVLREIGAKALDQRQTKVYRLGVAQLQSIEGKLEVELITRDLLEKR